MKYKPESDIGESDQRLRVGLCRDLDAARGLQRACVQLPTIGYGETDKTGDGASQASGEGKNVCHVAVHGDTRPGARRRDGLSGQRVLPIEQPEAQKCAQCTPYAGTGASEPSISAR